MELDLGWLEPNLARLQRREASGPSAGLSRAIAERLGVDAVIVRVVFISLAFCAGLGVAVYLWGTGLTRGPQGTRPIDQVLPGFRSWSPGAQKTALVASTIIFVAICAPLFPLQWGAGVLILLALLVWRRRVRRPDGSSPMHANAAAPAWGAHTVEGIGDDALVEQWREAISQATGPVGHLATAPSLLPEVDLYSHDDTVPARAAEPPRKANWWAGATILAVMTLTSLLTYIVLGVAGDEAVAITTAAGGAATVLFALVLRRRRVPLLAVVIVAVSAIFSGWLAVQTTSLPAAETPPDTYTVSVVADDAVVDLTTMDLTGYTAVRIDTLLADVEIILPASIEELSIDSFAAEVTDRRRSRTPVDETEVLPVAVHVSAKLSNVTIEEQS